MLYTFEFVSISIMDVELSYWISSLCVCYRQPSLVNFGLVEKFPNLPQYRELQPPTVEVIGDLAHL